MSPIDPNQIALGIRQPWAELILREIKTIEVRSRHTDVRGPIYLYASKKFSDVPVTNQVAENYDIALEDLPRGLLVGTAELVDCRPCQSSDCRAACVPKKYLKDRFAWQLVNPQRLQEPLPVRFLPYGVWFYPFRRRRKRGDESNGRATGGWSRMQ